MNKNMLDKVVDVTMNVAGFGSVLLLIGIALKRNKDAYEAQCKLIDKEFELGCVKSMNKTKDQIIERMKKDIDELRNKEES